MILYLHGFNSSSASTKAQQTLEAAREAGISCQAPDLPNRGCDVQKLLQDVGSQRGERVLAIGSSLGGYYATWMVEANLADHAVVINPAVKVARKLEHHVGEELENYYSDERYIFTQEHVADLDKMELARISHPSRFLLMVQTGDEVLDHKEAVDYYAGSQQIIEEGGDHGFSGYERHLPLILKLAAGDG